MEKENNNVIEISLSDFWKVFKRCWWVLLAVAVLFCGAAYLYLDQTHVDRYEATAKILITRTDGKTTSADANLASAIIEDCEKLALSEDRVVIPAIEKLVGGEVEYSESELKQRVSSVLSRVSVKAASTNSHILNITVTSPTPDGAAKLANAMAQSATEYFNSLFGKGLANISDTAKVPTKISNPISLLKVALVGFAAAALVYIIWLVIHLFDDRIDSEDKVEKRLGLTILGSIPYQGGSGNRRNRYGSAYGYYGYGPGLEQQKTQAALSSKDGKKEDKKA